MKKRFMLTIEEISKAEDEAILDFCRTNNYGWWHWFDNFWLLFTEDMTVSPLELTEKINKLFTAQKELFVMEIPESHRNEWAGWGVKEKFDWLGDGWKEE